MPAIRNSGALALGGIVLAAVFTVIGHAGVSDLDPVSLTVSDYAVSDSGEIIHIAMLLLAAASAVLIPTLGRLSPPGGPRSVTATRRAVGPKAGRAFGTATSDGGRGRAAEWLLAVWAGGLLVSGLVPTNPPGTEMDTAAYVHRYASVVAFLALPIAGWLLAARLPAGTRAGRWLRALTVTSLLLAVAMAWSAYPGDRAYYGLIERALIVAEVGLLTVVAAYSSSWSISWRPASVTEPERLG
ncbi:DUF998 domain-containing protein [Micromonospora sediminimaris]|uniref:DUF998 domain-containing protein n=1 Tax=Micromonospora sediminimaris TaxID=547162 RepID=A0A9W5UQB0_9ACTN|nr:DUF998 domain-containing protein [Micromonospora sediminimaris]GIJ32288.1 hypothetical protein Vse01_14360 [Micromonospora sediminimaris]SFD10768.1 Protein of unknown function [Micromonospora sediminimaris]